MKKIVIFAFALLLVISSAGCGNKKEDNAKTLTCGGIVKGNNMNVDSSVTYKFIDNKVDSAKVKFVFKDITIDNLSSAWDTIVEQFTEQNTPVEETGYKRTVKANNKEHTFSVFMDIDYKKITKDAMDKYGIEDYGNKTMDEIKEEAKNENLTCK